MNSFEKLKGKIVSFGLVWTAMAGLMLISVIIEQLSTRGKISIDGGFIIIPPIIMALLFICGFKRLSLLTFAGFMVGIWWSGFLVWRDYPQINMYPGVVLSNYINGGFVLGLIVEIGFRVKRSLIKADQ